MRNREEFEGYIQNGGLRICPSHLHRFRAIHIIDSVVTYRCSNCGLVYFMHLKRIKHK
jgi:hypothetical protein